MTIGTNDTIHKFGTQDTVTAGGGTSAVSDGAYSASGDVVSGGWTNDDDAPMAVFSLIFQYPSGTIDINGVHLFCRRMNYDGTSDDPQTDSAWPHHKLGTFATDSGLAATTNQAHSLGPVPLPNMYTAQVYEFYILNDCGVTMSAGWTLKITPMTFGPHA